MLIDQEISVRGVFVLADARFDDRRIFERGEAAGEKFARGSESFGGGDAGLRVGIDGGAVAIVGDFEAAGFEVGRAVEFVAED
jgi:hypothetical protein